MTSDSPSRGRPPQKSVSKSDAQIVVDALLAHGADTVFGYIGASVLPLFGQVGEMPDLLIHGHVA